MKITKTEKIWLAAVIIFYICYNLPFVPPYGHAKATLIHGLVTLVPLWIAIYVGLVKVCRIYRIRDVKPPADPEITGPDPSEKDRFPAAQPDAPADGRQISAADSALNQDSSAEK